MDSSGSDQTPVFVANFAHQGLCRKTVAGYLHPDDSLPRTMEMSAPKRIRDSDGPLVAVARATGAVRGVTAFVVALTRSGAAPALENGSAMLPLFGPSWTPVTGAGAGRD